MIISLQISRPRGARGAARSPARSLCTKTIRITIGLEGGNTLEKRREDEYQKKEYELELYPGKDRCHRELVALCDCSEMQTYYFAASGFAGFLSWKMTSIVSFAGRQSQRWTSHQFVRLKGPWKSASTESTVHLHGEILLPPSRLFWKLRR